MKFSYMFVSCNDTFLVDLSSPNIKRGEERSVGPHRGELPASCTGGRKPNCQEAVHTNNSRTCYSVQFIQSKIRYNFHFDYVLKYLAFLYNRAKLRNKKEYCN